MKTPYATHAEIGIIGCDLIQSRTGIGSYFFSNLVFVFVDRYGFVERVFGR
jgi:hypothetical protein